MPVSSEAILEVQQGGTIRASPLHELVQIHPTQRDSVQFSGATPAAVARYSESDTDSVPGMDRRTRRRLSLVWRSHTMDPTPNAPDLSVSRVRRAMEVHQSARMVSPRSATQATQVDDMGDSFRDGNATPAAVDPVTPEVFPLSDDADVALLPSREVVASRRVVLVPHSPGTPRSAQDRSVGSIGSRFAVLESMRKRKWSLIQRLTSQTQRASSLSSDKKRRTWQCPLLARLRCQKPGCHGQSQPRHGGYGPFVLFACSGDEESTKVPPWCVSCSHAHRFEGNHCRRDVE